MTTALQNPGRNMLRSSSSEYHLTFQQCSTFQEITCITVAFRAVARSATHKYRVSRPAPWPRARMGARAATLPWPVECGAGNGAPPPPPPPEARQHRATPTGGAVTPPRSTPARGRDGARAGGCYRSPCDGPPLTVPRDGVRNRRRAAATEAGAQARSPASHRRRVQPP